MKKLIAISFLIGTTVCFYSFNKNTSSNAEFLGKHEISSTELWSYMQKKVFPKLNDFVGYDKKERLFSRCPSGFHQIQSDSKSSGDLVSGIITFAEGCSREKFCYYEINWDTKDTKLKKKLEDEFVAISTFVKYESKKIAKI